MESNRRKFIQKLAGLGAAGAFLNPLRAQEISDRLTKYESLNEKEIVKDESYWSEIRRAYSISPNFIVLNNGGVSPQPKSVQEAVEFNNQMSNMGPSYYMWRLVNLPIESIKIKLAELAGCSDQELVINRNATEALETIIFGLRLKKGDHVVISKWDYPSIINAWKQRAHRDEIDLEILEFDHPFESDDAIVEKYFAAFRKKTKVVQLTHMTNWNGQILPIQKIAKAAKEKDIDVVLDAAHSFAQIPFKFSETYCDYMGVSLHKWLCAPFGTGMLVVRKEKIKNLYPLFASGNPEDESIEKFSHLGTRSLATEQGIGYAIDFHNMIGTSRKQQRLFYLKNYLAEKIKTIKGIKILTPESMDKSGAILLFSIEDHNHQDVINKLFKKNVFVGLVKKTPTDGIRISPNVFNLTSELDFAVNRLKESLES